ncbi:MAG: trypsin-like serine peptidase [Rhodospirillales bacterium]
MTVSRGLAALVLTCAVCAAALTGARGELRLSIEEEDRVAGSEDTTSPSATPAGLDAVGRISACLEKECRTHCTGFLVGPDIVVTAAHCVKVDGTKGNWYDPARIRFHSFAHPAVHAAEYVHAGDFKGAASDNPHDSLETTMAHTGQDIAILRLEERLGDKLGWLPKGKVNWDELAGGGEYEVAGIPGEKLFHLQSCRLHPEMTRLWLGHYPSLHSAFERGMFFHTCHMRGGFSGSPLLRRANGKLTWIGVNSSVTTMEWPGYHLIDNAGQAVILLPNGKPAPLK